MTFRATNPTSASGSTIHAAASTLGVREARTASHAAHVASQTSVPSFALAALNADVQSKGARITELESALAEATTEIELLTKKLNELMKPKTAIDHTRPVNYFDRAFSEIRNTTPEYENAIEQRLANLPKDQQRLAEINYARSRPVGGRKKGRLTKKQ